MTSSYRRDHEPFPLYSSVVRLSGSSEAISIITTFAEDFEAEAASGTDETPSEGERRALKEAMARFVIDSGIASARGWV